MIWCEADCADSLGTGKPKPPSLAGSADNSCVCSLAGGCPVSAGIKCDWIAISKGSRMLLS